MSTAETKTHYTPEDLLTMPDGDRYELVDGQLVEHTTSFWPSYVAGIILRFLGDFCEDKSLGWVVPEGTTYQCFPHKPDLVRKADVSFIRLERFSLEEAQSKGHVRVAPDLAVEVISPNDKVYELDEKIQDYLTAGVRLVWVVNPETRKVRIHRADGSVNQLEEQDELDGEDLLPGLRIPIRKLFVKPAVQGR